MIKFIFVVSFLLFSNAISPLSAVALGEPIQYWNCQATDYAGASGFAVSTSQAEASMMAINNCNLTSQFKNCVITTCNPI